MQVGWPGVAGMRLLRLPRTDSLTVPDAWLVERELDGEPLGATADVLRRVARLAEARGARIEWV